MSIVIGLMLTQISGLFLATPTTWRFVLLISSALAVAQFVLSASIVESPAWLRGQHKPAEAEAVLKRVWKAHSVVPASEGGVERLADASPRVDLHLQMI